MKHCAIYARLSKKKQGAKEEDTSPARQVEHARAFIAKHQDWVIDETHVYVDPDHSGAEFERRPAFMQMMSTLKPKAPFQILVVSEQKSIGREMSQVGMTIKQLAEAGVEILEYGEGKSLTPKNYLDKMMSMFQSGVDEGHRADTAKRVRDAHTKWHGMGRVTGGRLFGYVNKDVMTGNVDVHGREIRSHVKRERDPREAPVVKRIFELYASGIGLRGVAKQLNSEGAPYPKPFTRKDPTKVQPNTGWAPSTVRSILGRETYRGRVWWNRTQKRNDYGKVDPTWRNENEWLWVDDDNQRIITDELWERVQSRRADTAGRALSFADGRLTGRPPKHGAQNLLAGLASCTLCGGGLIVVTSGRKRGRLPEYVCHRHRANGTCTNALRMPTALINEAVLHAIEEHALTPDAIERVIQLTERDDAREQQVALARERKDIDKRSARLIAAIETGGDAVTLVARVRELEARRAAIDRETLGLQPVPRLPPAVIEDRLGEWRRLLRLSITQGRAVIQRIVRGRIAFTPRADGRGYDFTAPTRFDRLFTGVVVERPMWLKAGDVRGTEHIEASDTLDVDYGLLLEQATMSKTVKCLASPTGLATFQFNGSALQAA